MFINNMYLKIIDFILILNFLIISIGLFGIFFNKKNFLMFLISIEIMFLGINLNFILISILLDDLIGHIFVFFILTIITCESAVALSLFIILYKLKKNINIDIITNKYLNKL